MMEGNEMTRAQKVQFIEELIENVQCNLIRDVEKFPEEWEGLELRRLIAIRFAANLGTMSYSRTRLFNNTCFVKGL